MVEAEQFNPSTGRYERADGRPLTMSDLRLVLHGERLKLQGRLLAITERFINGEIITEEWQRLILAELKESNLIAVIIGAGGHIALNANRQNKLYFEQLRDDLIDIAAGMAVFTLAILAGEKTAGQIRGWAKYQARTVFRNFNKADLLTKKVVPRHNEAMRLLDITAKHCSECPAYDTGGQWVDINDVVPPTVACSCRMNCKCTVITRFNPLREIGIIGQASLADMIN